MCLQISTSSPWVNFSLFAYWCLMNRGSKFSCGLHLPSPLWLVISIKKKKTFYLKVMKFLYTLQKALALHLSHFSLWFTWNFLNIVGMRYLILLFLYMDSQLCQRLLLKILLSPHWMKFLLCYPAMYEFFLGSLSYRLVDLSILATKTHCGNSVALWSASTSERASPPTVYF